MDYYISNTVRNSSFDEVEKKVTELLKAEGFGVITEIDVQSTFKKKLDIDYRPYKILGACNPVLANKVLESDDKMGVMLPCNVCIQQKEENTIEVFAINPLVAMKPVDAEGLEEFAKQVSERLNNVVQAIAAND
ncbi:MAG: DUF302 domain-containing protein [Prolixibacteraceae bacterium]|jgi:uncharacterized protein (DUF302 family)|nr:DUF302 domain-containing protein [Prolixibacteraceae bacterium]